jgi:hypothetical protein
MTALSIIRKNTKNICILQTECKNIHGFGISLVSVWYQFGISLVSVWYQFGISLVSVWYQSGISLVSVWYQSGISLVSVSPNKDFCERAINKFVFVKDIKCVIFEVDSKFVNITLINFRFGILLQQF